MAHPWGAVRGVRVDASGQYLATFSAHGSDVELGVVKVWDWRRSDAPVHQVSAMGGASAVSQLEWAPGPERFLAAVNGRDAVLRLFSVRDEQMARRGLPRPADVLALATQRFDLSAGRLNAALEKNASAHERDLVRIASRLSPGLLARPQRLKAERVAEVFARARPAIDRRLLRAEERLTSLDKLRVSLNPDGPLARGFARIHHADGTLARRGADLRSGEAVRLVFAHDERGAVIDGQPGAGAKSRKTGSSDASQGDLF